MVQAHTRYTTSISYGFYNSPAPNSSVDSKALVLAVLQRSPARHFCTGVGVPVLTGAGRAQCLEAVRLRDNRPMAYFPVTPFLRHYRKLTSGWPTIHSQATISPTWIVRFSGLDIHSNGLVAIPITWALAPIRVDSLSSALVIAHEFLLLLRCRQFGHGPEWAFYSAKPRGRESALD